ncbi:hypothetical protein [Bdellovibrio bacteriovorus]|uniref:hypothetical protein n=1 Tax=Bdellovibrio TaxID=958 RepID=UPI0035A8680C
MRKYRTMFLHIALLVTIFVISIQGVYASELSPEALERSIQNRIAYFELNGRHTPELDKAKLEKWIALYERICLEKDPQNCLATECDIVEKNEPCRKNHVVLFRGESKVYKTPATSHFFRYSLKRKSLAETLEILNKSFLRLLPLADEDFYSGHLPAAFSFRITEVGVEWLREGKVFVPAASRSATLYSPTEFLMLTHMAGSYLKYVGDGDAVWDSMVSFSADPRVAKRFAEQDAALQRRVVVISVDKASFFRSAQGLPEISQVVDPSAFRGSNEFSDEVEYDVFVAVDAGDIFDSLLIE